MKRFFLAMAFGLGLVYTSLAQVNQQAIRDNVIGKRWALALYIVRQATGPADTVIRARDCATEFVEFFPDGTFESPDLERPGQWQITNDSTLLMRKPGGGRYKQLVVIHASKDSLAALDKGFGEGKKAKDVFVETYKLCLIKDASGFDNRETYTITDAWGLGFGYQQFRATFAEIGIGRGTFGRKGRVVMPMLNVELAPWNQAYGLVPTVMLEDRRFVYGLALAGYTTPEQFYFRLRPMAGFALKGIFGEAGYSGQLFYGYNVAIGEGSSERLNLHSVNLRLFLPLSRKTSVGKWSPSQEYER
ncbi:MAG: hypothetical protein MUC97_09135 [Bernardetiaceae bacterium]|nr:hypothetical protein [Bernardetiaceae bacterium]